MAILDAGLKKTARGKASLNRITELLDAPIDVGRP